MQFCCKMLRAQRSKQKKLSAWIASSRLTFISPCLKDSNKRYNMICVYIYTFTIYIYNYIFNIYYILHIIGIIRSILDG